MSLVRDLEKTFSDLWHHEASAKAPDSTWVRVRPRADTRLCVHGGRMQTPGSVCREAVCRHQALCAGRLRADSRLCVYREATCRLQALCIQGGHVQTPGSVCREAACRLQALCIQGGHVQTPGSMYTGRLRADSRLCVYTGRPGADTRLCVFREAVCRHQALCAGRPRADSRLCVYTGRLGAETRLCVFREATCRHQALCAGRPRADTRLCVYREAACRHQAASLPIFSLASLTESLHIDGRSEVLSGGRAQSVLVSSWLCSSGGPVAPGAAHLAGLSVFCVLGRISRMGGPWYLL